jgi:protease I
MKKLKRVRTVIIIGPGFEDVEAMYPLHRLQEEGIVVDIATSSDTQVKGKHGISLSPTVKVKELNVSKYDAVIVPGGLEGPDRVRQNSDAVAFVKNMYRKGKLVSSICHGPWVLASAGVLRGKKATCYIGMKDDLINAGAIYTGASVTVDGNLITSDHPRHVSTWLKETVNYLS